MRRLFWIFLMIILALLCSIGKGDHSLMSSPKTLRSTGGIKTMPGILPDNNPSDSLNVRTIGKWPFGYPCWTIDIDEQREAAFVCSGGGIYIVDVQDPSNPVKLSDIGISKYINDILYQDSILYVADRQGFGIISVADLTNPELQGFLELPPTNLTCVAIQGSYAYVTDDLLRVISIEDPENPVELAVYDTPGQAQNVCVDGDYVYVADEFRGLRILSVVDPENPFEIGYLDPPEHKEYYDISIRDSLVFVTDLASGLVVISVADPENPRKIAETDSWGMRLEMGESYAFLSSGSDGVTIVSIEDPANPSEIGVYYTPFIDRIMDSAVFGTHLFVCDEDYGMTALDILDPSNPTEVGTFKSPSLGFDIEIDGNHAYLASASGGLRVLSIEDPAHPRETGFLSDVGYATGVSTAGSYAYVTGNGLSIVSIEDPENPVLTGSCNTDEYYWDSEIRGSYAYVTWLDGILKVISIEDPAQPFEVGACDAVDNGRTLALNGSYAYVCTWDNGLRVISIEDPSSPIEVGSYVEEDWMAQDIVINGLYAYVVGDDFRIFSLTDPQNPVVVGQAQRFGSGIGVSGTLAYLTCSYKLSVLSVSDPENPVEVGFYQQPCVQIGMGNHPYSYVLLGEGKMHVYEFFDLTSIGDEDEAGPTPPLMYSLEQNYPNPFNPSTTISFEIPDPEEGETGAEKIRTELSIFDIRGKLVKAMLDESLPAGRYRVTWNGRNGSGANVSSGIYFYRIITDSFSSTRKMILMK